MRSSRFTCSRTPRGWWASCSSGAAWRRSSGPAVRSGACCRPPRRTRSPASGASASASSTGAPRRASRPSSAPYRWRTFGTSSSGPWASWAPTGSTSGGRERRGCPSTRRFQARRWPRRCWCGWSTSWTRTTSRPRTSTGRTCSLDARARRAPRAWTSLSFSRTTPSRQCARRPGRLRQGCRHGLQTIVIPCSSAPGPARRRPR
mmetsp:Transcript_98460/g.260117  ORF Transcript_98460/g.260117 Transcript_98460/m.260117 type:complete len:204 (-) Transcript_98460:3-614(-)